MTSQRWSDTLSASEGEVVVALRLSRAASWSGWSLCINSLFALWGRFSGQRTTDWTSFGAGAQRQGFGKNEGGDSHTMVVRSSRNFIHGDIKLDHFEITARKPTLQVASEEQHSFLIISVG
jgi:hypothetical protein